MMVKDKTTVPKLKKRPALRFKTGTEVREVRKKLGLNQAQFWSQIGVTQSGGSRYESGRNVPKPVQFLLHVTYGTEKQATDFLSWLRTRPVQPQPLDCGLKLLAL
jgi:transcriptional regulator with XRE-family HTH domain